jgi:hypothetical protein
MLLDPMERQLPEDVAGTRASADDSSNWERRFFLVDCGVDALANAGGDAESADDRWCLLFLRGAGVLRDRRLFLDLPRREGTDEQLLQDLSSLPCSAAASDDSCRLRDVVEGAIASAKMPKNAPGMIGLEIIAQLGPDSSQMDQLDDLLDCPLPDGT